MPTGRRGRGFRGLLQLVIPFLLLFSQVALALPTVTLTSPTAGQTFVAPATITLSANATPTSGSTVTKVEFYRATSTLIGTVTGAANPHVFSWTGVAAGTYKLTAKAYDSTGNKTSSSATITVNANALPSVSITSPANGATLPAPSNIVINASASDTDGTVAKVEFLRDATVLATLTTPPYTTTITGAAAGTYNLTARATDNLNGVKTSTPITVVTVRAPPLSASPCPRTARPLRSARPSR